MITIEKLKENDFYLMNKWKCECENEYCISNSLKSKMNWKEEIQGLSKCFYWIIRSGALKIGMIDINHVDKKGCVLEYYIGDRHFRGRNITKMVLWNVYNYIFYELKMEYAVTIVFENDIDNLERLIEIGAEIKSRFKKDEYKNEKIDDVFYVLMKKEKWNNIKDGFNFEEIYIEK